MENNAFVRPTNIFVVATNNGKKLAEMKRLLADFGISVITLADAGVTSSPEETGKSFSENARIKAYAACEAAGMPAIADDSGLCVDALGGEPGVCSARFGGEDLDDGARTALLLEKMRDVPEGMRTARFKCVICAAFPNGDHIEASGSCEGMILFAPEGENGFGYDPVFSGETGVSFGLLPPEEKDKISHRARALAVFRERLASYLEEQATKNT